jgi:hypothetical protein
LPPTSASESRQHTTDKKGTRGNENCWKERGRSNARNKQKVANKKKTELRNGNKYVDNSLAKKGMKEQ